MMMMNVKTLMILGGLLISGSPAGAGEIELRVRSYPELGSPQTIKPVLQGSKILLKGLSEGRWNFQLSSNSSFHEELSIVIDDPPAGYGKFRMQITVPFFWDRSIPLKLTAAIAKGPVNNPSVRDFLRDAGPSLSNISDIILLHQRASRLWAERLRQLSETRGEPNEDDVRVAYWLIQSMIQMVERQFAVVDEPTRSAANWMRQQIGDHENRPRLFKESTVTLDVITEMLSLIEARDSIVYNRISNALHDQLKAGRFAVCPRVDGMDNFISDMDPEERRDIITKHPTHLKVKTAASICKARALLEAKKTNSAELEKIWQEIQQLVASSAPYLATPECTSTFPKECKELNDRTTELSALMR